MGRCTFLRRALISWENDSVTNEHSLPESSSALAGNSLPLSSTTIIIAVARRTRFGFAPTAAWPEISSVAETDADGGLAAD